MEEYVSAYTGAEIDEAIRQVKEGESGTAYTPQRGVDYWTAEDIATIKAYVDDAILNGSW